MTIAISNGGTKFDNKLNSRVRRLSAREKTQFARNGYIKNLPVFAPAGVAQLQKMFDDWSGRVPEDIDINRVNMWHKASRTFFELCHTPAILDYVEDVIGPNFYQWGGQFFVKYPNDGSEVPWHQDSQYWPLSPERTVTAWLAIYDTDATNAAMQVIRGSHKKGAYTHHINDAPNLVLQKEVDANEIDQENIVTLDMKAGEISLHDSRLIHGSGPNKSDLRRCGITMRYCPTEVKCDLSVWPTFETYLARGVDKYRHNPMGPITKHEKCPTKSMMHSSEFK